MAAAFGAAAFFANEALKNMDESTDLKEKASDESFEEQVKWLQSELARAYDLKTLNAKFESTGQIWSRVISIDGTPIEEFIEDLEEELNSLFDSKK